MIIPCKQTITSLVIKPRYKVIHGFSLLLGAGLICSTTPYAISQTSSLSSYAMYAPVSSGLFSAYALQEASNKPARKTVQIKIISDRKTGLLYATIKGRKLQARKLSYLEKEAQKAYPDYTIQLVDGKSGHIFTMPRTMLGIILQPISGVTASQLNIKDGDAIVIDECFPGLPADRSHLQKYDIILSCDGKRPITKQDFTSILNSAEPGDRLNLIVLRGGQEVEIEVTLAAYDPVVVRRLGGEGSGVKQGMRFDPLASTPTVRNNLSNGTQPPAMRDDMNRLMIQLQDQEGLLPMELAGSTSVNGSALAGARNSDIEGRLLRMQGQLDRIEQLLGMMLQDQYGGNHKTPTCTHGDTPSGSSRK